MIDTVRTAGVQMNVALGDVEDNLRRMLLHLAEAARGGAKLVVFPEAALTGYCFETREEAASFAQPIPGPATDAFAAVCRELDVCAVFGMVEAADGKLYNAAAVVGPRGLMGRYRKIHLPYLGLDRFVAPGQEDPEIHEFAGLRFGVNICYDGSFPEISRLLAIRGVDLIALPTNWPPGGETAADGLTPARALENHIYYLAVNRIGHERGFDFIGKSRLVAPHGTVIGKVLAREEVVFYGDVHPSLARQKHLVRVAGKHEIHRFRDRRPEMYGDLAAAVDADGRLSPPAVADAELAHSAADAELAARHKQLWAPWRLDYVTADKPNKPARRERPVRPAAEVAAEKAACFVCRAVAEHADEANLVIARTGRSIAISNRFPYNNGHLLVCPQAHKAHLDELTPEEAADAQALLTRLVGVLEGVMQPDGFNVGLNLGRAAGAGLPGHLHWHIVPRWNGDTNFMPVLGGVRVIPQSLEASRRMLVDALRDYD